MNEVQPGPLPPAQSHALRSTPAQLARLQRLRKEKDLIYAQLAGLKDAQLTPEVKEQERRVLNDYLIQLQVGTHAPLPGPRRPPRLHLHSSRRRPAHRQTTDRAAVLSRSQLAAQHFKVMKSKVNKVTPCMQGKPAARGRSQRMRRRWPSSSAPSSAWGCRAVGSEASAKTPKF